MQQTQYEPRIVVHGAAEGIAIFLVSVFVFALTAKTLEGSSSFAFEVTFLISSFGGFAVYGILNYIRFHLPGLNIKFDANPKNTSIRIKVCFGFNHLFSIRYKLDDGLRSDDYLNPLQIQSTFEEKLALNSGRVGVMKNINFYGISSEDAEIFARTVSKTLLK